MRILVVTLGIFILFTGEVFAGTLVPPSRVQSTSVSIKLSGKNQSRVVFCLDSVPGSVKNRGANYIFDPFNSQIKIAKSRKQTTKLKLLKALRGAGKVQCGMLGGEPSTPGSPNPTPPSSGLNNFDSLGNTTENGRVLFQIPGGTVGNVTRGKMVYESYCVGCHVERVNYSYTSLDSNIRKAPMLYDDSQISRPQELADLAAYLNRFRP